jgi:hypothetical protein
MAADTVVFVAHSTTGDSALLEDVAGGVVGWERAASGDAGQKLTVVKDLEMAPVDSSRYSIASSIRRRA